MLEKEGQLLPQDEAWPAPPGTAEVGFLVMREILGSGGNETLYDRANDN